jgi:hypothetical protein
MLNLNLKTLFHHHSSSFYEISNLSKGMSISINGIYIKPKLLLLRKLDWDSGFSLISSAQSYTRTDTSSSVPRTGCKRPKSRTCILRGSNYIFILTISSESTSLMASIFFFLSFFILDIRTIFSFLSDWTLRLEPEISGWLESSMLLVYTDSSSEISRNWSVSVRDFLAWILSLFSIIFSSSF